MGTYYFRIPRHRYLFFVFLEKLPLDMVWAVESIQGVRGLRPPNNREARSSAPEKLKKGLQLPPPKDDKKFHLTPPKTTF